MSTINSSFIGVDRHMDNQIAWADMTREQQLNATCNTMAKDFLQESIQQGWAAPSFKGAHTWTCIIDGHNLTTAADDNIQVLVYKDSMQYHLDKKGILAAIHFNLVE